MAAGFKPTRGPAGSLRRAAAALLLAASGCSWITVRSPPKGPVPPEPEARCTASVAAPVVDTVLGSAALGLGATGVVAGVEGLNQCAGTDTCWIQAPLATTYVTLGALLVGVAVVEGFSAAHGYRATAACRALQEEQLSCLSGVEPSCAGLRERGAPAR
jgi:hypothetical protein